MRDLLYAAQLLRSVAVEMSDTVQWWEAGLAVTELVDITWDVSVLGESGGKGGLCLQQGWKGLES